MTAPPVRPGHGAAEEAAARFDALARQCLETALRLNPTQASALGYHECDSLLEDYSAAGVAAGVRQLQACRERLEREVQVEDLDLGRRIDHGLLLHDIEGSLFRLQRLRVHHTDPTTYNDILGYSTLFLTLLPEGAPEWPDRLGSLLARMQAYPGLLDTARANLENPSAVLVDYVIGANRASIDFFRHRGPELFPRAPQLRERLESECARTLAAVEAYQRWLEEDLRPRVNGDWRLGRELWEEKLRLTLQSDVTPEEIRRQAEDGLRADREAMLQIAEPLHSRWFPAHTHRERGEERADLVVREVIERVSQRHSDASGILQDVRKWIRKIKAFLATADLVSLPPKGDSFVVEPTPGFLDGLAVAFFNPPPAFEPWLKKSFWISSVEGKPAEFIESFLREYNDYALQDLTIHEAFPGHYVQFWHALNSPVASIYKKVYASSTFAEGWAVMAEKLLYDGGYAADEPENLLIHKKMQLRTYINALLDQRFHTTTREEATDAELDAWAMDLMCRVGFQERAEAEGKIRRAKVSSTQLSTYFVGYLELAGIAREARQRGGSAFRARDFHDKLLSYGTIPPREVRRLLQGEGVLSPPDPARPDGG